jgi:primosomal protein N' (replication factor Y)
MNDIYLIYLPLKLDTPYSYAAPKHMDLKKGDVVLVPLKNQEVYGIVYAKQDNVNFDRAKLKFVIKKAENIPNIQENLVEFLEKLSAYNLASFGNVLKMAINVAGVDFNSFEEILTLNIEQADKKIKLTPQRKLIFDYFSNNENGIDKKELSQITGVSTTVISGLIKEGILEVDKKIKLSNLQKNISYTTIKLREDQEKAAQGMITQFKDSLFNVAVLKGVPGSGKTEVYFEVLNETIKKGEQVLIMLPEIALSTQIVSRFKDRFGVMPYVWHSSISKKQKKDAWISAGNGDLKVIIGARSALCLPFKKLGLIIVDEEHDSSYKQDEGVIYNARDMAVLRAKMQNVPIILSSATPSLESMNNVEKGKYKFFSLSSRHNLMALPKMEVIDLKEENLPKGRCISNKMLEAINQSIIKNEQVLLFVNKRGYASCVICKKCGEKVSCPNCAVSLVEHRGKNILQCHYCGYSKRYDNSCQSCDNKDCLVSLGAGVERVYEEINEIFPNEKALIISSDTINSHKKAEEMVAQINNLEYKILIGTQIISKGYHFPKLTTVGILDADFTYDLDLKANERAWQILYQVAGRSGRGELEGRVLIQTFNPENPLVESLKNNDYDSFLKEEEKLRKSMDFPPFGKLAAIIVSSKDKQSLYDYCNYLAFNKFKDDNVEVLGFSEAPIAQLRGYYRNRFLVKTNLNNNIQSYIKKWLGKLELGGNIKIQIDIDPISFY